MPKTYLIKVKGVLDDAKIEALERGVKLEDGFTAPAKVNKVSRAESNSWLEVTIHEGRKHQVKRMIEAVGHSVIKLTRVRMGPLLLGDLGAGEYRFLTDREANRLRELVEDRVARAERPELDASGKPMRWMPPTEPAPPKPPKPERSGRGPKSQRAESGPRSQRSVAGARSGRPGRGGPKRPLSPGAKFRRPTKTTAFQRPQPGLTPQGDERNPTARPTGFTQKPQRPQPGAGFQRPRSGGKSAGTGRSTAGNRSGSDKKFQQNRRSGPSSSRPGQRGPARQSRNSTRRRA